MYGYLPGSAAAQGPGSVERHILRSKGPADRIHYILEDPQMLYSLTKTFKPKTILVTGEDGRIHKARVITRTYHLRPLSGYGRKLKYLYFAYRDGKTVRQIYLGKLA